MSAIEIDVVRPELPSENVNFRLRPHEKAIAVAASKARGMRFSEFCRLALRNEIERGGQPRLFEGQEVA